MTLEEVNQELLRISDALTASLPVLREAEARYNRIFYDSILRSGMGNAQSREAEANLVCEQEGVLQPFVDVKTEVRTLINQKECIIEIAKNIRVMRGIE